VLVDSSILIQFITILLVYPDVVLIEVRLMQKIL